MPPQEEQQPTGVKAAAVAVAVATGHGQSSLLSSSSYSSYSSGSPELSEMNNQDQRQEDDRILDNRGGGGGGGSKKYNKKSRRVKRGRRVKVCPLKLVGLFPKHVMEKIIPAEAIGQEMELRLTWPGKVSTSSSSPSSTSEIVFRISRGTTEEGTEKAAAEEETLGGDKTGTSGGSSSSSTWKGGTAGPGYWRGRRQRRRGIGELNVMDCALQLFNSRNCNDFLYFTIQRDLGASSGNRYQYNVSMHEFPRGAIPQENGRGSRTRSSSFGALGASPPPRKTTLKSGRREGDLSWDTAIEHRLRVLCGGCRGEIKPNLQPEFQRQCLGCEKHFGFYGQNYQRDEGFFDDERTVVEDSQLRVRKAEALAELRRTLIQFNVHLQTSVYFFSRVSSRVARAAAEDFANLFNVDVVQSGAIEFRLRVVSRVDLRVQFLCHSQSRSGEQSQEYKIKFKLLASPCDKKCFDLCTFRVEKQQRHTSERTSSSSSIPELLVSSATFVIILPILS